MTDRMGVVHVALGFNGMYDGVGYDHPNLFSTDLGRPPEAWCGDFVTDVFRRAGLLLPSIQPGCRTGFAYCPSAVEWARTHNAWKPSWQGLAADLALCDWNGDGVADHVEMVIGWANNELATIGGNSGPSNADHFRGKGGVHGHLWADPQGQGNREILGVLDTSHLVSFSNGAPPAPRPFPTPTNPTPRLLMLKSPMMKGNDVAAVQNALNHHGQVPPVATDGWYGPQTRDAVMAFQGRAHIGVDGVVGPQTRGALGI